MDKINFQDLQAEHINRYRLAQIEPNVYDMSPERGTVTQAGTTISALLMNQLQDNIEKALPIRPVNVISGTSGSIVQFTVTDSTRVQQSGSRMSIMTSADITASTRFDLRLNAQTYVPIYKPTGGASDYITTLKANVVYELVLTTVNSALRWVCINLPLDVEITYTASVSGMTLYFRKFGRMVTVSSVWTNLGTITSGVKHTITDSRFLPVISGTVITSIADGGTGAGDKECIVAIGSDGSITFTPRATSGVTGWIRTVSYLAS